MSATSFKLDDVLKTPEIVQTSTIGPCETTFNTVPMYSGDGINEMNFLIRAPSFDVGICRRPIIHMTGRFVVEIRPYGEIDAEDTVQAVSNLVFGLKQLPLSELTRDLNITINNVNYNMQQLSTVKNIAQYMPNDFNYSYLSPTQPDNCNRYTANNIDVNGVDTVFREMQGLNNFYTQFANQLRLQVLENKYLPKSTNKLVGYRYDEIVGLGYCTLTYEYDIYDYVQATPFACADSENNALYGIDKILLSYRLRDFRNVLCTPALFDAVTDFVHTPGKRELFYTTVGPITLPKEINYKCPEYILYSNTFNGAIDPNGLTTLNYELGRISVIPKKIAIWVTPTTAWQESDEDINRFQKVNVLLPLSNLSINYMSKTCLSGAAPVQLYEMSRDSGLSASFEQFTGAESFGAIATPKPADGSDFAPFPDTILNACPIVIDVAKYLSLRPGLAPGVAEASTLKITVTALNNLAACGQAADIVTPINEEITLNAVVLNVALFYDRTLTISRGQASLSQVSISPAQIKEARVL